MPSNFNEIVRYEYGTDSGSALKIKPAFFGPNQRQLGSKKTKNFVLYIYFDIKNPYRAVCMFLCTDGVHYALNIAVDF